MVQKAAGVAGTVGLGHGLNRTSAPGWKIDLELPRLRRLHLHLRLRFQFLLVFFLSHQHSNIPLLLTACHSFY